MSRNGIDPIRLWILSCKLDVWVYTIYVLEKFFFTCRVQDDTSVIHIPLPHFWKILGSVDGFHFKVLHEEVGHYGADGRPMAAPLICSWKLQNFRQNSSRLMICSTFMVVLEWSSWSSSSLLWMMLIAASMGTEVSSAETSYEVMVSFAWRVTSLMHSMKSPMFLM